MHIEVCKLDWVLSLDMGLQLSAANYSVTVGQQQQYNPEIESCIRFGQSMVKDRPWSGSIGGAVQAAGWLTV